MGRNIIVITTTDSKELALRIADELLSKKAAACVNIFHGVLSRYWWKGSIASEEEIVLLIKTADYLFPQVSHLIKELHSYQCPEVISLPITAGSQEYLKWLKDSLAQPGSLAEDQS